MDSHCINNTDMCIFYQVKVTEDSEDYSSYPLPVIENTALVIKKKTVSTSTDESTSGNIVNYKRFKKVINMVTSSMVVDNHIISFIGS